jgi:hypothetical protein
MRRQQASVDEIIKLNQDLEERNQRLEDQIKDIAEKNMYLESA